MSTACSRCHCNAQRCSLLSRLACSAAMPASICKRIDVQIWAAYPVAASQTTIKMLWTPGSCVRSPHTHTCSGGRLCTALGPGQLPVWSHLSA